MNTSGFFTTALEGATGAIPFDDTPARYDKQTPPITKILVHANLDILYLEVVRPVYYSWNDGRAVSHGAKSGLASFAKELTIPAGEYITRVEGLTNSGSSVVSLTFITNQGTHGPIGGSGGTSFVWEAPRPRMSLLAFSGYVGSDTYVTGLRGIFCDYPGDTSKSIQYERRSPDVGPSETLVPPQISESFSSFTFHLMNPFITLHVGEARVEFHVHKDTLCRLPFFQAALTGGFKEASEQVITLPEDNAGHISVLIEFLYTGNYTYAYGSANGKDSHGSPGRIGDLAECLFHVGIQVIASKYDCQGLLEIATRHFDHAESELTGLEALRLWKVVYAADMRFSTRARGTRSASGLAGWVKGLFRDHREEMEDTFVEYPMMASDILRVSTDGE